VAHEPLPIRPEDVPDEAIVVIRAGVMERATLEHAASQCFQAYGLYGISVEAVVGATVDAACRSSRRLRQYRHIRLSTVGRLHEANVTLLPTFEHPHFTVVLPDLSELTLVRIDRCFDPPIPNPGLPRPQ
jgi:hypothetical protein